MSRDRGQVLAFATCSRAKTSVVLLTLSDPPAAWTVRTLEDATGVLCSAALLGEQRLAVGAARRRPFRRARPWRRDRRVRLRWRWRGGQRSKMGRNAGRITAATRCWLVSSPGSAAARLVVYIRIAALINRLMTSAARDARTPDEIRAWQERWDSVIAARAVLRGSAIALPLAALVTT
jgi:hypothetical protein